MSEIRVTSVVGENGGDPVGLTTGLTVGPLTGTTGIGATITHQGHAQFAGVCTATSFSGSGENLTGISSPLSFRNKIINGAMTVSQRHGTTVVTGVNATGYRIDRWTHQMASVNSAFSVSQSTDSPDGFGNSYKIDVTTADTSLAAAHAHFFRQKIEGQNLQDFAKGTSAAKQFALSFYVKTNKTGVYTVELYDIDNNRAISKTFTVVDSNWNRYIIIFPADTTGAFDNDNGNSLVVQFFLSAGSNYTNNGTFNNSAWGSLSGKSRVSSSNVNFADSTSNNWYITGVQLEVGSSATAFEHRTFADELRRCQRYLFRLGGGDTETYTTLAMAVQSHSTLCKSHIQFPVQMRSKDITYTYADLTVDDDVSSYAAGRIQSINSDNSGKTSAGLIFNTSSMGTVNPTRILTDDVGGYIQGECEL